MSTPTKAAEALITIDAVTQEAENRLRHPYCSGERRMDFRHGADWAISVYEPERQRLIALLADMEGQQEPVAWMGQHQGRTILIPAARKKSLEDAKTYAHEKMGHPHTPDAYPIPLYTHPSPTASDAKDSAVDVQEVIKAGDAMAARLGGMNTGDGLQAVWKELTKHHRP